MWVSQTSVTLVERSPDVSFANCGLPYFIGNEITDRHKLALQTPESLSRQLGIKVLTNTEATKIDRERKVVAVKTSKGEVSELPYDKLVFSPGASPLRPASLPGIEHKNIVTLRNLQDMDHIKRLVDASGCKHITVVGAGFIGLEMVEQLHRIGKAVSLVEKFPQVLPQADEDMAEFLTNALIENGIDMHMGSGVKGFTASGDKMSVQLDSGKNVMTDLVVLSIGVRPESSLAKEAGLTLNSRGYVVVNDFMQSSDPSIYAVGDVVETRDLVFPEKRATVALGNIANMQARIAADHAVLNKTIPYTGSLGTSIVRGFDTVLALTGWNEKRLKAAGIPYEVAIVTDYHHASYYPGALPLTLKMTFDKETGRIYGAQAVGMEGADKRIDVLAMAITGKLTIEDLSLAQLCYSPPFGSARDVANVVALNARNIKDGLVNPGHSLSDLSPNVKLIDVRPPEVAGLHPIPGSINIPDYEISTKAKSLDPTVEYRTVCAMGKMSYFASRKLLQAGLQASSLIGGLRIHSKPKPEPLDSHTEGAAVTAPAVEAAEINLDCTGMACPGPLLKLKTAASEIGSGGTIHVRASDPGFKADVKAFAKSSGFTVDSLNVEKGIIHATLRKEGAIATLRNESKAITSGKNTTIVVFSMDLDKMIAAFVIANGAAAMGGQVTMFFTFWGLSALRDPSKKTKTKKSIDDWIVGKWLPSGADKLPLSNFDYMGIGPGLLKMEMQRKHLPNISGLMQAAKDQNIKIVACTMSMEAMGIHDDELIDGVEFGGVAEYLSYAHEAGTNLFI